MRRSLAVSQVLSLTGQSKQIRMVALSVCQFVNRRLNKFTNCGNVGMSRSSRPEVFTNLGTHSNFCQQELIWSRSILDLSTPDPDFQSESMIVFFIRSRA